MIERTVRKLKRERDAYKDAGLEEDARNTNIRIRRLNKEYKDFSKAAGLPEQRERMKAIYTDNESQTMAAQLKMRRDAELPYREAIKNGEYSLTINAEKQARHMEGTALQGRSVITITMEELQEIINKNAGNGKILMTSNLQMWQGKEIIYAGKEVGFTINSKGDIITAKSLKIHYSKTGIHAVPYSRRWKK